MMNSAMVVSPEEMSALGASYAEKAVPGSVFALVGPLGAGKTNWTKGFVGWLGGEVEVTSPTFSIVNEYRLPSVSVFHFDFYRLKTADELIGLGWDEYLDRGGIVICEWADLFPGLLPSHATWLKIEHRLEQGRLVTEMTSPV